MALKVAVARGAGMELAISKAGVVLEGAYEVSRVVACRLIRALSGEALPPGYLEHSPLILEALAPGYLEHWPLIPGRSLL
jgi:hypothetical protein